MVKWRESSSCSRIGRLPPVDSPLPISRISPASMNSATIADTVGRVMSARTASVAREIGPKSRISAKS